MSDTVSRKALELLQSWLNDNQAYRLALVDRQIDCKKWAETGNEKQMTYYKPKYEDVCQQIKELEADIVNVERAKIKLFTESEGEASRLRQELLEQHNDELIGERDFAREEMRRVRAENERLEGEAARLRETLEELKSIIAIMQDASESSSLRYNAGNMGLHKINVALSSPNTAEPAPDAIDHFVDAMEKKGGEKQCR